MWLDIIVKLAKEKRTTREIASILGISKSKSAFWVKRFKDTVSLQDKKRSGRPTPLTEEELISLKSTIKIKVFLQIIEHKTKRKYTLRHAQRILHKIGFSLITPRVSHIRKDEKAQAKFRREFKKREVCFCV